MQPSLLCNFIAYKAHNVLKGNRHTHRRRSKKALCHNLLPSISTKNFLPRHLAFSLSETKAVMSGVKFQAFFFRKMSYDTRRDYCMLQVVDFLWIHSQLHQIICFFHWMLSEVKLWHIFLSNRLLWISYPYWKEKFWCRGSRFQDMTTYCSTAMQFSREPFNSLIQQHFWGETSLL